MSALSYAPSSFPSQAEAQGIAAPWKSPSIARTPSEMSNTAFPSQSPRRNQGISITADPHGSTVPLG